MKRNNLNGYICTLFLVKNICIESDVILMFPSNTSTGMVWYLYGMAMVSNSKYTYNLRASE